MAMDMNQMHDDTGTEDTRSRLDAVKTIVSDTAAKLSDAMPSTDDLRAGADRLADLVKDNPVGFALGSVAAGFLLGVLLPRTSIEADRMEDVKRMAKDAGSQVVEAGKQLVLDTVSSTLSGRRPT
jgi:ElaB/YqjD/DUF883 family membrane-anchored ribosome-binding protein